MQIEQTICALAMGMLRDKFFVLILSINDAGQIRRVFHDALAELPRKLLAAKVDATEHGKVDWDLAGWYVPELLYYASCLLLLL